MGCENQPTQQACPACAVPMRLEEVPPKLDLETHRKFLEMLKTSGAHLLNVVTDILDFSKLEAGKLKLYLEDVQVSAALRDPLEILKNMAASKDIQLVYEEKAQAAGIPVFICTAYHSHEEAAKTQGGLWMPKPFNGAELVSQICAMLKR